MSTIKNLNLGRSFFFANFTREVKIMGNKPDLRGMFPAKITNLLTGQVSLRPVKLIEGEVVHQNRLPLEIH